MKEKQIHWLQKECRYRYPMKGIARPSRLIRMLNDVLRKAKVVSEQEQRELLEFMVSNAIDLKSISAYRASLEKLMGDWSGHLQLRPARREDAYCEELPIDTKAWSLFKVEGEEKLKELGLECQQKEGAIVIEGTPTKVGMLSITLVLRPQELGRDFGFSVDVEVRENPKLLWEDRQSDMNSLYWKADSSSMMLEATSSLPKRVIAASLRGRSHAHRGVCRDDDFKVETTPDGWYILCVADGAGSCKYAREGSRVATSAAVTWAKKTIEEKQSLLDREVETVMKASTEEEKNSVANSLTCLQPILYEAAKEVFTALQNACTGRKQQEADVRLDDYSTTLLLAIAKKYPSGWFIADFWVGDGAVALYRPKLEGEPVVKILGRPDHGLLAGQTRFITMPEIFKDQRIKLSIAHDFEALILATDGITDPYFENDEEYGSVAAWDNLWGDITLKVDLKAPDADKQLLKWLEFYKEQNHDDRTIIILH